jgi:TetR/AcrR family transcriptional repressor of nem operon
MIIGRPKQFDDATVVRAARDLFWERGYASTSLADLQAATGLSRSSLYQTYGSKQGLFDRALDSYCDEIIWPIVVPMEVDGAGRDEVVTYFRALARHLRESPHLVAARGCMIANTASELNILDKPSAQVVRDFRDRVYRAFVRCLTTIADRVDDIEQKADVLTAAQIGLMISARYDPIPAAMLAENIAADVQTW